MKNATIAALSSTSDRLNHIPQEFWIRLGIAVLIIIAVIAILRKLAKTNKVVLAVVCGMVATFVGFNWVYERNEPQWARPAVGWLAGFFPSKPTTHF